MKKSLAFILTIFFTVTLFGQTKISEKELGKKLEKNKDASQVFVSEIDLNKMEVLENGTVILPQFSKNKIKFVSGMDMTNIKERLSYKIQPLYEVSFTAKDVKSKTYAITKIDGIESAQEYKTRIEREAKEAEEKRLAEEKIRLEKEKHDNLTKLPVQVINQEVINITGSEAVWLPGQIQDKLKSNLQEYLGMKTVVDSKSEAALKKLQAESESEARDEATAIEVGKITTAKYALFTKIRKTGSGYTISADFTDLTTGEQMASVTSKEYSALEYLYGSTGAVDEITLGLGNKLNLKISDLNKNLLTSGMSNFSLDDQLALAKQNEENFNKLMKDYDDELSKLMTSNDINAVQNKNRIEAEKALLVEKQNAEKKRQEDLKAQKVRAAEDEKLETERSIALKTKRDKMAKNAAEKAAEVRKLKIEKQGVLGQINIIESKKKALVEIRQSVENRSVELYNQMVRDKESEEKRIRNKSYSTVELGSDGNPTEQAKKRRENQVIKSNKNLTNKFFEDCESAKQSTMIQQKDLLTEIRADQKALKVKRTVSSMGDELKVNYGKFEGSQNGWNAYISLYSDGVLLYTDNFIINYEALSGKKAPDMATELDDAVIEEYTNNVDMYNSLLTRGDPIIYFEIDYNVTAEVDDKPSQYKFYFSKIRVINTVTGKTTQTSALKKVQPRTMKPERDLRKFAGILEIEKSKFAPDIYKTELYMAKGMDLKKAKKAVSRDTKVEKMLSPFGIKMVNIPNKNFKMLNTEVTQKLYTSIMGSNPSNNKGDSNPVEKISWYDAIYFCNKLSESCGLAPVYSVDGKTDVSQWNYTPHKGNSISGELRQNLTADGFRLPTEQEWEYAARGGEKYNYSGSENLDEVGWYQDNSGDKTHPVAQKKANSYGLYDMSGNVWEWCWVYSNRYRYYRGGGYDKNDSCKVSSRDYGSAYRQDAHIGFRIVYSTVVFDKTTEFYYYAGEESKMVNIPGTNFKMLNTEVTQKLYTSIMGSNPSNNIGDSNPVERVSWYDAIYFCNKLSEQCGLTPVYSVNEKTDVSQWNYKPHIGKSINGTIRQAISVNGFRLPTEEEWEYAARSGKKNFYAERDVLDKVGWYKNNSGGKTHPVAQKNANGYGLYDMSGNVSEWCWDVDPEFGKFHHHRGGDFDNSDSYCQVSSRGFGSAHDGSDIGFRIVCSASGFTKTKVSYYYAGEESKMVSIPGRNFKMLNMEVTQKLYTTIMGSNPSNNKGDSNPVERVSWYDAIYFCNKYSKAKGLKAVYSVDGKTDVSQWNYTPHKGNSIRRDIKQNLTADGFRLPTEEEWVYAAKGGQDFIYFGSNDLDEVGWYLLNSGNKTNPVAQKKANGYGLYDMSGNVWEWCWDVSSNRSDYRYIRGGGYSSYGEVFNVSNRYHESANGQYDAIGFRIVCSASE